MRLHASVAAGTQTGVVCGLDEPRVTMLDGTWTLMPVPSNQSPTPCDAKMASIRVCAECHEIA